MTAPLSHAFDILKRSGPNGIYIKEKVRDERDANCVSALIHSSHTQEKNYEAALEKAKQLPHFCGVHRSNTGSKSFRFQPEGIENARRTLCKADVY